MDKNTKDSSNQKNGALSTEKTNEDHNKQKPDPNNPNQTKNHQIGEEEEKENQEREIEAKTTMPPKTHHGDEGNKNTENMPTDQKKLSEEQKIKQNESTKIHSNHQHENENREKKADAMRTEKISQPDDSITGKL